MNREFMGLIAPPFAPFDNGGELDLGRIESQYHHLAANGVSGAFVCGSSGEGVSLSVAERQAVAERWREVAGRDFLLIVQVGALALPDARALAAHAQHIGANAVAAAAPCYFKPDGPAELARFCGEIASAAPELSFYYYHIPYFTGVYLPMAEFLAVAAEEVPTLAGVKFTHEDLMDFGQCCRLAKGRFNMLFGRDEILLAGLALGASGAIGTTYNFAAPLYARIVRAYQAGDLDAARDDQARAMAMIALMRQFGGLPAAKAMMKMVGVDCGPVRPPLRDLTEAQCAELRRGLEEAGFFEYCTKA